MAVSYTHLHWSGDVDTLADMVVKTAQPGDHIPVSYTHLSISPGHYAAEKAFSLANRNAAAGGTVAGAAGR